MRKINLMHNIKKKIFDFKNENLNSVKRKDKTNFGYSMKI